MKRFICIILFIVTIATLTSCTNDFEKPYEGFINCIEFNSIDFVANDRNIYEAMRSDSSYQLSIEYVSENMVKLVRTRISDDTYEVFYIPVSSIKYISIDGENLEK